MKIGAGEIVLRIKWKRPWAWKLIHIVKHIIFWSYTDGLYSTQENVKYISLHIPYMRKRLNKS